MGARAGLAFARKRGVEPEAQVLTFASGGKFLHTDTFLTSRTGWTSWRAQALVSPVDELRAGRSGSHPDQYASGALQNMSVTVVS